MALSEIFNLDFKFGGNTELLAKMEALLNRIDQRFESVEEGVEGVEDAMKDAADATNDMADAVDDLSDSFKDGLGALNRFGEKLKDIAKYYLSFQAIRSGAERVWSFGMQSMEAYSTQERAENQLKGVMKNRGTLDQFKTIKDFAAQIQGRSIYGDEAMIRGAGELATYVKGTESLKSMMTLLTDYAAGMTGGGEVSPEQMESLATGLGMAYDGNYMAMRRKGFDTSKLEALDALAENGGKWTAKMQQKYGKDWDEEDKASWKKVVEEARKAGGITEKMRVDALKDALGDWKGLSDEVNKLDSSALVRLKNSIGDLRENIGKKLYPTFNKIVDGIEKNMPSIESAFSSVGEIFETLAQAIVDNLDNLKSFVQLVSGFLTMVAKNGPFLAKFYLTTQGLVKLLPLLTTSMDDLKKSVGKLLTGSGSIGVFAAAVTGLVAVLLTAREKLIKARNDRDYEEAQKNADDMRQLQETKWKKGVDLSKQMERFKQMRQKLGVAATNYAKRNDGVIPQDWVDLMNTDFYGNALPGTNEKGVGLTGSDGKHYFLRGDGNRTGMTNPFGKAFEDALKSGGKGDLHQTFNNTTINQKVNITAEAEKLGMMLNFSIQKAIKNLYKRNGVVAEVGVI